MNNKLNHQPQTRIVKPAKALDITELLGIFNELQVLVKKSNNYFKDGAEQLKQYTQFWEHYYNTLNDFVDFLMKYIPRESVKSYKN